MCASELRSCDAHRPALIIWVSWTISFFSFSSFTFFFCSRIFSLICLWMREQEKRKKRKAERSSFSFLRPGSWNDWPLVTVLRPGQEKKIRSAHFLFLLSRFLAYSLIFMSYFSDARNLKKEKKKVTRWRPAVPLLTHCELANSLSLISFVWLGQFNVWGNSR